MADSDAQHDFSVTPDKMARLRQKFNGPPGDSGTLSGSGVTMQYKYDSSAQVVHLTVTGKPFFVSYGTIWSKVGDAINGA